MVALISELQKYRLQDQPDLQSEFQGSHGNTVQNKPTKQKQKTRQKGSKEGCTHKPHVAQVSLKLFSYPHFLGVTISVSLCLINFFFLPFLSYSTTRLTQSFYFSLLNAR